MKIFSKDKNIWLRFFSICLVLVMMISTVQIMSVKTSAADTITETLNLTLTKQNQRGEGYFWDNINNTLTLYSISIVTDDEYGLKVPHGVTIELQGKSYISASYAALGAQGDVTIKGNGSLMLVSDEIGIDCYATTSTVTNLVSGTININSKSYGIKNDSGTVTAIGGDLDIKTRGDADAFSVYAHLVQITGGRIKADASIYSETELRFINVNGDISSARSALISEKDIITVGQMKMNGGDDGNSLSAIETYSGEKCLKTKSDANRDKGSMILGKEYSQWMDVVLIILAIIVLAAIVGIPLLVRYRRTEKLKKRLAEEAERKNKI